MHYTGTARKSISLYKKEKWTLVQKRTKRFDCEIKAMFTIQTLMLKLFFFIQLPSFYVNGSHSNL